MIRLRGLHLDGFRSYRNKIRYSLETSSLILFGPNGSGKTAVTEAFTFLFSESGTTPELGERDQETKSGRLPLINVYRGGAEPAKIFAKFDIDGTTINVSRDVLEERTARPVELEPVFQSLRVSPVISTHDMRALVVAQTGLDRFRDLSKWLGAAEFPLAIQRLRQAEQALNKVAVAKDSLRDLALRTKNLTAGVVPKPNELRLRNWLNAQFAESLASPIDSVAADDISICDLRARVTALGPEVAQEICDQILAECDLIAGKADDLHPFEFLTEQRRAAHERFEAAMKSLPEANSVDVVTAAQAYLQTNISAACPVCATPFADTVLGSQAAVLQDLLDRARIFDAVRVARDERHARDAELTSAIQNLSNDAEALFRHLRTLGYGTPDELERLWLVYRDNAAAGDIRGREPLVQEVGGVRSWATRLQADAKGGSPARAAHEAVEHVLAILDEQRRIVERSAQANIYADYVAQGTKAFSSVVARFFNRELRLTEAVVRKFYEHVHGSGIATNLRLELADPEEQKDARALELLIDFGGRNGVKPLAYLSDSQIHTLALALRIATIKQYNEEFPFIILDDVVSSLDANVRRATVKALADILGETPFLLLTHDEMFATLLREQMGAQRVSLKRLLPYRLVNGSAMMDFEYEDEVIARKHSRGEFAGNDIRKLVESWLKVRCAQLGGRVRMKPPETRHIFDHSELVNSLGLVVKPFIAKHPEEVRTHFADMIREMQSAKIENASSHDTDAADVWASVGDEVSFWNDFRRFRRAFQQTVCGHTEFKVTSGMSLPHCKRAGCEAPFALKVDVLWDQVLPSIEIVEVEQPN